MKNWEKLEKTEAKTAGARLVKGSGRGAKKRVLLIFLKLPKSIATAVFLFFRKKPTYNVAA